MPFLLALLTVGACAPSTVDSTPESAAPRDTPASTSAARVGGGEARSGPSAAHLALLSAWLFDRGEACPLAARRLESIFGYDCPSVGFSLSATECYDTLAAECSSATAPILLLLEPTDGETFTEGEAIQWVVQVADDDHVPSEISLSWVSDLDGEFSTEGPSPTGRARLLDASLSAGVHEVVITATDPAGESGQAALTLTIEGGVSAPVISLSPANPTSGDDLGVSIDTESVSPSGGAISYLYSWRQNGAVTSFTGATLPASETARGDVWQVEVSGTDGASTSASDAAMATVRNSRPSLDAVTLSPDPAYEADTLTCTPGTTTDADPDVISFRYQWLSGATPLPGAEDATLDGAHFDRGDSLSCRVTPNDGLVNGVAVTSNEVVISNTAPQVSGVSISPASPSVGDVLTCTYDFSDGDGDADASTYSWTVNGAEVSTASTLSSGFAGGDAIVCAVTAHDGVDAGNTASASVTPGNTPPVLADVTLSPDPAYEADTLTCTPGATTDADGTTSFSYTYAWTVAGATIAATGDTLTGADFDRDLAVTCTVTPSDGASDGAAVTSNSVTISNTAPSVSGVSVSPASPAAGDTLSCSYSYSDEDGDADASTYAWTINGTEVGADSTLSGGFAGGDAIVCAVTAHDGTDTGNTASASVTPGNTPPVLADVTLSPDPAYEADTLTCTPGATTDADGTTSFSYSYTWTVAGATIAATGATLTGADFDRDQAVTCAVTPNDGGSDGAAVDSNSVTISNTAPVVSSVSVSPSSPAAGDTLTCTYDFSDDDSDADASTYAWTINGVAAGTTSTLSGGFAGGDAIACAVTAHDGTDEGNTASASVTPGNTPPVLADVTLGPDPAYEADTLTCTPGTTTDADGTTSFSYSYTWTVAGATIAATGATLTGADFDRDQAVTCAVTPNDGGSDGAAVDSNSVTISNTAPVVSSVSVSPSSPAAGDTLTCTYDFSDDDSDADASTYAWTINGVVAGTTSTLSGGFAGGDAIVCAVTAHDGTDVGNTDSASVTPGNTPPVLADVTLSPDPAYEADTLTCTPGATTDADGTTSFSYTYAWTVAGATIAATGDTLTGADFDRDLAVTCTVTPSDGSSDGAAVDSNTVTISNTAPSVSDVSISPANPLDSDTLTCSYSFSDADGDADASSFSWTVDGVEIGTASVLAVGFSGGDTVVCTVTARDGTDAGGSASASALITADNTPPVLADVSVTPAAPTPDDDLRCVPGAATDDDGDTISFAYAWTLDGVDLGVSADTLSASATAAFDTVRCVVTPTDGEDAGAAVTSAPAVIANNPPVISAVSVSPQVVYTDDQLVAVASAADPDGAEVRFRYTWTVNGGAVAETGPRLSGATAFERGDSVQVSVTPDDGDAEGDAVASAAITVMNSPPSAPAVTITPEEIESGVDPLVCAITADATDADGDDVSYAVTWAVDGVTYPDDVSGAAGPTTTSLSGDTVPAADTLLGGDWRCVVTPDDGEDAGAPGVAAALATPAGVVGNYDLAVDYLFPDYSIMTGNAFEVLSSLEVSQLGWVVYNPYAYHLDSSGRLMLYRDDGGAPGELIAFTDRNVIGNGRVEWDVTAPVTISPGTYWLMYATDSAHFYIYGDLGTGETMYNANYISVYAEPADSPSFSHLSTGSLSIYMLGASAAEEVDNDPPALASVALGPDPASAGDTLRCAPGATSDADGDAVSLRYAWDVSGADPGVDGDTLGDDHYAVGDAVTCAVTPDDGAVAGAAVDSNTVTIANTPPILWGVALGPAPATVADTLTCTRDSSSDADGDPIFHSYAWRVEGVDPGVDEPTLSASYFSRYDAVSCLVTPDDGADAGAAVSSNVVVIANAAPTVSAVTISPASPSAGDTLTCGYSFADGDGDADASRITWTLNGAAAGEGAAFPGSFNGGDVVACLVVAHDGLDAGNTGSASVTAGNNAPTLAGATLGPAGATAQDTLTCAPGAASDADGDAVSFRFSWQVGAADPGVSGDTLGPAHLDGDDVVTCTVTPTDGLSDGAPAVSNALTVDPAGAPRITAMSLTPSSAYTDDAITVNVSVTDPEGDPVNLSYAWTVDGASVAETSNSLSGATHFDKYQVVEVTVTPDDGVLTGEGVSDSAVVLNTPPEAPAVAIDPAGAVPNTDALTCLLELDSPDADDDSVTYGFTWTADGLDYPEDYPDAVGPDTTTYLDDTVPADDTHLALDWVCAVTPHDGDDEGEIATAYATTDIFNVGYDADMPSRMMMFAGLYAQTIEVTEEVTVLGLGAHFQDDGVNAHAQFALYDDGGTGGGPGALLGWTMSWPNYSPGFFELDLHDPVTLSPGTYYVATYNSRSDNYDATDVYIDALGAGSPESRNYYTSWSHYIGAEPPDPWESVDPLYLVTYCCDGLALYMVVY